MRTTIKQVSLFNEKEKQETKTLLNKVLNFQLEMNVIFQ